MKYARARSRSIVLARAGILHSSSISPCEAVFGRLITTELPVDFTNGVFTRPPSAVAHSRAMGPPPVSSARWSPVRLSYQRGDITHVYLPLKSRFCGRGMVD